MNCLSNPENMGILVMTSGFGECMQKYFKLEQVAFNMSRDVNFVNIVSKLNSIAGRSYDSVTVDALNSRGLSNLTPFEKTNLAIALGFNNIEEANTFDTNNYNDMFQIVQKFDLTSYPLLQQHVIFESAIKYSSFSRNCAEEYNNAAKIIYGDYAMNLSMGVVGGAGIAALNFWNAGAVGVTAGATWCIGATIKMQGQIAQLEAAYKDCMSKKK